MSDESDDNLEKGQALSDDPDNEDYPFLREPIIYAKT